MLKNDIFSITLIPVAPAKQPQPTTPLAATSGLDLRSSATEVRLSLRPETSSTTEESSGFNFHQTLYSQIILKKLDHFTYKIVLKMVLLNGIVIVTTG